MAPLRRAAAAGSLVIDDYQKILNFFGKGGKRQFFACEDLQSILYLNRKMARAIFVSGPVQTQWVLFRPGAPKKEVVSR